MEIIYDNKKYWLLKIGEPGRVSNQAVCLDENGEKVKITLNFTAFGGYVMPIKEVKTK